jgi:hypothetical protein
MRFVMSRGVAQAKENLETMTAAAEEATDVFKNRYASTLKGTQEYSAKIAECANTNIHGAVEHATKLMTVKTPMDFFALSNEYTRRQFQIFTRQAQELAGIVKKMTIAKGS